MCFRIRGARIEFDVSAGDQGADARDLGGSQARLDHPKAGAAAQEVFGIRIKFEENEHRFQVVGQFHVLHDADLHRTAADFGFSRRDSVRGIEADTGDRSLSGEAPEQQPTAKQQRHERDHPHDVPALGAPHFGGGGGERGRFFVQECGFVAVGGVAAWRSSSRSQSMRGSKLIAANIVSMTTPANASAPGPGTIDM